MDTFLKKFLDDNKKDVKKLEKFAAQVNQYDKPFRELSDEALQAKTDEFKARLEKGETLNDIMAEAFAVVREASDRVLGLRHFDVQIMGGHVLHEGRIAEMKTGEGKTLVATAPVYLNALEGKGVHVVTVNDYLARRDAEQLAPLYNFLGLSVGLIVHGLDYVQRKDAYACDITYGTNNEFGFDYLRDNMVMHEHNMVQRPLNFAIVDEVDSILIDEARTPLIISGPAAKAKDLYTPMVGVVRQLKNEEDYTFDEKLKTVALTEEGTKHVERLLGIDNLTDEANVELAHHVNQALKAQVLMKRDRDYVVQDGEVIIVDEFTGRLMYGRRYSEGLHQAIEAKEGVNIEKESQTLATITFQNYFRMYKKLAGMTGTAKTEEDEFRAIYGMDVVIVPTNKPIAREDAPDIVYRTENGKFEAVADKVAELYEKGEPVLVGTVSIEKSEKLSDILNKRGVPHKVLNAKYHEQEALIVAQAGQEKSVTIATNMAGRGTDIILGGNPGLITDDILRKSHKADEEVTDEMRQEAVAKAKEICDENKKKVVDVGGLYIIGTERHESRRIDNQLRGRSGRQGDPGHTQFYISLEDDLMRRFGAETLPAIMDKVGMNDEMPIENRMVSRTIENAQKRVESRNFETRKNILEYDDVMNKQREIIYTQRRQVLEGRNMAESISGMIDKLVDTVCDEAAHGETFPEAWNLEQLALRLMEIFNFPDGVDTSNYPNMDSTEVREELKAKAHARYAEKEEEIGPEIFHDFERNILLRNVDTNWMDHLDAMDQMRQGIGLRAYGQHKPIDEYRNESYDMFNEMTYNIQYNTIRMLFAVTIKRQEEVQQEEAQQKERVDILNARHGDEEPVKKKPVSVQKVGRNDPCPCGSGKKYKHCCGKNA
ncbi:MAG: preprotein translocase subunit SecA [Peptococcaceae bacterium]|nr:preprotein translocase subunit SecA [Peptococcaceae bacterium]